MWKRQAAILGVLVLVAAAVHLPLMLTLTDAMASRPGRLPTRVNIIGPEASLYGWPGPTPHERPWPDVTQWSEEGSGLHRRRNAWSNQETSTHQMQVDLYGWPLAVLERTHLWWPWDDPAWAHDTSVADSGLRVRWSGLVLNPLVAGLAVWGLACGPVLAAAAARRAGRTRRRQCVHCGYPIGMSELCTECGRVATN